MGTLDGKGALVTGGSRGIGRAIVQRLAADGASVVFSYLANTEAAGRVVGEVTAAGGRALAVQADQGSLADLRRLSAQAEEWLDGLDIVVINAAGGGEFPGLIDEVTEETYDGFMAAHAKGPFFLIQYAGRTLRDGGRIIAISPLNTRLHPPGGALYTGAKGALEHFTKVAALEFGGRGITANIVSPGATDTELSPPTISPPTADCCPDTEGDAQFRAGGRDRRPGTGPSGPRPAERRATRFPVSAACPHA